MQVPWNDNASKEAAKPYAYFPYAAESYILFVFPEATQKHFGRASKKTFGKVAPNLSNEMAACFRSPMLPSWNILAAGSDYARVH